MVERNTFQKRMIRETIDNLDHPSAGTVFKAVHKKYSTVSRATVFRICANLANKGELLRLSFAGCEDRFDTTLDPHYHIICDKCGRVADVSLPYADDIIEKVSLDCDFTVTGHILEFRGICSECIKKHKSGGN